MSTAEKTARLLAVMLLAIASSWSQLTRLSLSDWDHVMLYRNSVTVWGTEL